MKKFNFLIDADGYETDIIGFGFDQAEADKDAKMKLMRNMGLSYDKLKTIEVISEEFI